MTTNVNQRGDEPQTIKDLAWMKKRSRLERVLCLLTVVSLLTVAALIAALIGYHRRYNSDLNSSNVCLTPGCVKAASLILSRLDENIDPCDDFYRFACGGWLKTHHIPDDKSSVDSYSEAQDNFDMQIKILLETKLNDTEPSFIRMAKDLYGTCMDSESIEKAGAEPLKYVLKSLGGWPVVEGEKWDERKFDWLETLISFRKLGYSFNTLLSLAVGVNVRNTSSYIIDLDEGLLGIDSAYLIEALNDSVTTAYYKKMVKAAMLLGVNEFTAEKELLDVLQFELILANYSLPLEERRNASKFDNKYTVKALQKMVPQIPWLKYIRGFFNTEIYENEILNVQVPEYVKKVADLITRTEKRVIANYMLWNLVDDSIPLLSKEWRRLSAEFSKEITGKSEQSPRWKQCMPNSLDIALSSYFIRHHFKEKTKDEVTEIIKYVYMQFLHILNEIDWMDEKTKTHAKAKANNMLFQIAYPEELLNDTAVIVYYENLTISNDSYFENVMRIYKWSSDDHFSMLRKPNERTDWRAFAEVVNTANAFYSSVNNVIKLPAGYMRDPSFNEDRPNYLNFASIGAIVGHEITHGFDDEGRQHDKDGNSVNWWEKVTDENFRQKAQCIIDQYSNYTTETGMKLNGINTQGENIADIGGLKESYWAYQSWVKDHGPEQLLPGLQYSQNQLFWIGSAAFEFCSKFRPEFVNDKILSDPHSPDEFRVIGPLSNLAEFATDFNCPDDSPMNKKHKCQVW